MQRVQDGYVIISCDFCGTDWDQVKPMIEGHHGSVICLECLKVALNENRPGEGETLWQCSLCLRDLPAATEHWSPRKSPTPGSAPAPGSQTQNSGGNPLAAACLDCLEQAARAFDKDPDVDWKWERKKKSE